MANLLKKEDNQAVFTFVVAAEDFKKATAEAFQKTRAKYNIPGFRKGKATRKIIENYYGEGVFYDDALNIVLPDLYEKAIEELGLDPVAKPEIDIKKITLGEDIEVEASVYIQPEFDLPEYKGLKVELEKKEVTDEQVEEALKAEQDKNVRLVAMADRSAELGDTVIIDFKGFVGDEAFEGGESTNFSLELGSKSFIDTFEDQLVGTKAGDSKDVFVKFPEEYHAEKLAGADAKFEVTVHEVKVKEVPELNDDFASDVSEFDTLDEYKADLRRQLEHDAEHAYEDEYKAKLIEQLSEATVINIPEVMVDEETDRMVDEFAYQLQYQGLSLDMYLEYTALQLDDLKEKMKDDAAKRVKTDLVLEKLVKVENITASEEEVETEIKAIAERRSLELDKVKEVYQRDNYEALKHVLNTRKAIEKLVEYSAR